MTSHRNGKIPQTFMNCSQGVIANYLERYKSVIEQVVPRNLRPERVIATASIIIARSTDLKKCDTVTTINAVLTSAMMGLDLVPELGFCVLLPRFNKDRQVYECDFQIMYKGVADLVWRSTFVRSMDVKVVHEHDEFEFAYGLDPKLVHVPAAENRGALTHVYAIIETVNGGRYFDVLTRSDVMKHKEHSKGKDSKYSPWNGKFEKEMWKKTALLQVLKVAPIAVEYISFLYGEKMQVLDNETGEIIDK